MKNIHKLLMNDIVQVFFFTINVFAVTFILLQAYLQILRCCY